MRFENVKQIALYYKAIPGMLRLLRQEREELEEEYNCLRGTESDGMPRGSSPGKPTETLGLRAMEHGVGDRLNEIRGKERLLLADGKRRRVLHPKQKKLGHVRPLNRAEFDHPAIGKLKEGKPVSDRELRRALAAFQGGNHAWRKTI